MGRRRVVGGGGAVEEFKRWLETAGSAAMLETTAPLVRRSTTSVARLRRSQLLFTLTIFDGLTWYVPLPS